MATDYLAHYQIKGAKHGVRRFQNQDGSLTPLGRIRYGVGKKREASPKKKASASKKPSIVKEKKQVQEAAKTKSVKDMSDAELRAAIQRIRDENTYRELTTPKNTTLGQYIAKNIIIPGVTEGAKEVVKSATKSIGLAGLEKIGASSKQQKDKKDKKDKSTENSKNPNEPVQSNSSKSESSASGRSERDHYSDKRLAKAVQTNAEGYVSKHYSDRYASDFVSNFTKRSRKEAEAWAKTLTPKLVLGYSDTKTKRKKR